MKRIMFSIFAILSVVFGQFCLAQATGTVANPTYLDAILAWIQATPAWWVGALGLIEVALRFIPSSNALSVLVPVKYAVVGAAAILNFLANQVLNPLIQNANVTTGTASLK